MLKHVGDKHKAEREDEDKIKFSELALILTRLVDK